MSSLPGAGKAAEQTFGELAQTVSEQAVVLARKEVGRAQRELTTKAKGASTGVAMVGGAAVLGALAAGTGTAALVLLLARRPEPSAAALGVTGLYAGAGALLAREGISRLRDTALSLPEESSAERPGAPAETPAQQAQTSARSTANRARKAASAAPTEKAAAATRKAASTKKAAAATKKAATGAPAKKRRAAPA